MLHEIPFGRDHAARVRDLLGANPRNIANVTYEQPARAAYALADGRYAIVSTTTYGFSSHVHILPNRETYDATWSATLYDVPDPETGRPYGR